jgi:phosphotriesterase-related protein
MEHQIRTVCGEINADSLGLTLMHEHLLHDMSVYFSTPQEPSEKDLAFEPVQESNLEWVKHHGNNNKDNLKLADEELIIEELSKDKLFQARTIVELTTPGVFGRDPSGLQRISQATGINIIMGTGYDISPFQPVRLAHMSVDNITEEIVDEITVGVDNTGICAGIIGEIGCSVLDDAELKVLKCCAAAQQQTGVPISIHPSPSDELVLKLAEFLLESGAYPEKVIIGHIDIFHYSDDTCFKLLNNGFNIAIDNFGFEGKFHIPLTDSVVTLSDATRIDTLVSLINKGYINQLFVSQDTAAKINLIRYGGFGYCHIVRDIMPLLHDKGISDSQINHLLVDNPKRVLSIS